MALHAGGQGSLFQYSSTSEHQGGGDLRQRSNDIKQSLRKMTGKYHSTMAQPGSYAHIQGCCGSSSPRFATRSFLNRERERDGERGGKKLNRNKNKKGEKKANTEGGLKQLGR